MPRISKKLKKILDDYNALCDLHEEALKRGDSEESLKCGKKVLAYIIEHQKELKVSDDQLEEMKKKAVEVEKAHAECKRLEAELRLNRLAARKAEAEYYDAWLEMPPQGKARTEH